MSSINGIALVFTVLISVHFYGECLPQEGQGALADHMYVEQDSLVSAVQEDILENVVNPNGEEERSPLLAVEEILKLENDDQMLNNSLPPSDVSDANTIDASAEEKDTSELSAEVQVTADQSEEDDDLDEGEVEGVEGN